MIVSVWVLVSSSRVERGSWWKRSKIWLTESKGWRTINGLRQVRRQLRAQRDHVLRVISSLARLRFQLLKDWTTSLIVAQVRNARWPILPLLDSTQDVVIVLARECWDLSKNTYSTKEEKRYYTSSRRKQGKKGGGDYRREREGRMRYIQCEAFVKMKEETSGEVFGWNYDDVAGTEHGFAKIRILGMWNIARQIRTVTHDYPVTVSKMTRYSSFVLARRSGVSKADALVLLRLWKGRLTPPLSTRKISRVLTDGACSGWIAWWSELQLEATSS